MEEYPKSVTKKCTKKILEQLDNSIYKVCQNKGNNGFCLFTHIKYKKKHIPVLITTYEIINEIYISNHNCINIQKNNDVITIEFGKTKYMNKSFDLSVIEIKKNIADKINFLEIDESLYEKEPELNIDKESLYIIQNNNCVTYGVINNIFNSEIIFSCNINSKNNYYSPIFNLSNNKMIGIYKNKYKYYNRGIFFKLIINEFYKEYRKTPKNDNIIKLLIDVDKDEIDKKIYFLGNQMIKNKDSNNNNKLKILNELNSDIYINNIKHEFTNYFIPKEIGIYEIKLIIKITLEDCSFMFAECKNIININFISFNTNNVVNMKYMFYGCTKLKIINNLLCFNTSEVIDMSYMFYNCSNLTDLDLSSFNIKKVSNMSNMFNNCKKLKNLNMYLDFSNVNNTESMFNQCNYLKNYYNISSCVIKDYITDIKNSDSENDDKNNSNNLNKFFFDFKKVKNNINKNKEQYIINYLLFGESPSGKSSIRKRFSKDKFDNGISPTLGVDLDFIYLEKLNKIYKIIIYDAGGQELFHSSSQLLYNNISCCLIIYDITDRETFNKVDYWLNYYKKYGTSGSILVLVGNKIDLEDKREITYNEGKELAKKHGMLFFETSAKNGNNIDILFYSTAKEIIKKINNNYNKYTKG